MNGFLNILNEATKPIDIGPKEQKLLKKQSELYEKVEALTSREFVDELWKVQAASWGEESEEHFSRGFRLGAQAMLAVLSEL